MADSFQLAIPEPDASAPPAAAGSRPCVVVTGAAGRIGRSFVASAADRYAFRLLDHPDADPAPLAAQGELHRGDIADVDWVADLFAGAEAVVHLAADPAPDADWPSLPHNNIVGT
ncbi:MAG: NAD-dependent epimerase/dehydratase family protein, partial [Planctomycetota bacterium]